MRGNLRTSWILRIVLFVTNGISGSLSLRQTLAIAHPHQITEALSDRTSAGYNLRNISAKESIRVEHFETELVCCKSSSTFIIRKSHEFICITDNYAMIMCDDNTHTHIIIIIDFPCLDRPILLSRTPVIYPLPRNLWPHRNLLLEKTAF